MSKQNWDSERYSNNASFVSELGLPVLDLLSPKAGESILDLGCGDGTLALKIQDYGATVTGVDFSPEMIQSAQGKGINALCQSGEYLGFANQFDAVFSNAALHWMTGSLAVIEGVDRSLKSHGRFVGEFGGAGNINAITDAINMVYEANPQFGQYKSPWFFPSDSEYKSLLESNGFKVETIELIQRPTPLKSGIREWLKIFANHAISHLDESSKDFFLNEVEALVKPKLFTEESGWFADYVRLRFSAYKMA